MHPLISIIVNVYNGEKYIEHCINSLLQQIYTNIEILIIDDGSEDATGIISDRFSTIDGRVKVFHTENKGISGSRKYGLSKVSCDYFTFVDVDDWVEPNYIQELYNAIKEEDADIATCAYWEEFEGGRKKIITPMRQNDIAEYTRDLLHGRTWCVVWNKLFKTSIVKNHGIDFSEKIRYWEDVPFSVSYSLYCNKIAFVKESLYHYVKYNTQSLTATEGVNIEYNKDRVKSIEIIEKHLNSTKKADLFDKDILWLKFWIKDVFITHAISKERIKLWRMSFSEVNYRYLERYKKSDILHYAIVSGKIWYVLLYGYYYEIRHFVKYLFTHRS